MSAVRSCCMDVSGHSALIVGTWCPYVGHCVFIFYMCAGGWFNNITEECKRRIECKVVITETIEIVFIRQVAFSV